MVNPFDIYARASKHQPLTPAERAFLKTLGGLWQAALGAGAVAIIRAALQGGQPLTFATLGQIGAVAAATAFIIGVSKLVSAHGDMPLANALDQEAAQIGQQVAPGGFRTFGALPSTQRPMRYQGPPSGPITQRLPVTGATFPPAMPDDPQRRRAILQAAGATMASDPGAATRPVAAVSAPASGATGAQGAQTASASPALQNAASAPSPAVAASQPQDEATGDGPGSQVTQVMAAMRASLVTPAIPAAAIPAAGGPAADAWTTS